MKQCAYCMRLRPSCYCVSALRYHVRSQFSFALANPHALETLEFVAKIRENTLVDLAARIIRE